MIKIENDEPGYFVISIPEDAGYCDNRIVLNKKELNQLYKKLTKLINKN